MMQMTLHYILFKKTHISNQSVLKKVFAYLQKWFYDNYMVLNQGKCYYATFGSNTTNKESALENGTIVPSAEAHMVLGTTNDSHLAFLTF